MKAEIEGMLGDPNSAYWKGSPSMSAGAMLSFYRQLIEAEEQGASDAVEAAQFDLDVPFNGAAGYDISAAPGSRSMIADDRDVVDRFMPIAFEAGLGQQKFADALGYCFQGGSPDSRKFASYALGRGRSDAQINKVLTWYRVVLREYSNR